MASKPVKQQIMENLQITQAVAWENAYGNVGGNLSPPPPAPADSPETPVQVQQPFSAPTSPGSPAARPHCLSPTPVPSTSDPNWQATRASLRERNAAMFNNELMADVHFVAGPPGATQRIPAHKYVLATGSSVFYAMFYGGLADEQDEIEVPDVEPVAFLVMLRYLYTDEFFPEADTVLATLYAAKKYIVPFLARACVSYLETSLTAGNACLLLSQSRLFEEPELMQRCWEIIDAQAEVALRSEGFTEVDHNTLKSVLARETLNCKEVVVFEAALSWAREECQRRGVDHPTPEKMREALGDVLYLIRIPAMSLEEYADTAAQSGILTLQETTDIFLHYTAKQKPAIELSAVPRTGLKAQVCHRFQSSAYRGNQWRYRGRCDSIQFCVDKRIFIVGFGLYGSSNGAADYRVRMELKRLGRVLAENTAHFFSDGSSNTFHVHFRHPIQVEPDTYYTASAVLDGAELSYFGQEGLSEVAVGPVTFQFQCSSDSTNGTGVQGGQIPELMFYGPSPPAEESRL
ncbi:BTB/POZ domain-containing protein 6-like [Amphibalanus amphitrite]|uniref:BTB/POZ domain-containing protein 6-like n=1 Tax=Amphibalanus amphitrite TaxID=1232801 RepID=UPI001C914F15|nr:BTB/POZ domain-containing protein 6-like [Amphibalanus amphitrite]